MDVQFLLGPAGSGKTFRCIEAVRAELRLAPDGPPLLFITPKQATFQLERQLLQDTDLPGFTRLHILSFSRLAERLMDWLEVSPPEMLSEQGRVMVLRALLGRHRDRLKLFHASARMPGLARKLGEWLASLQEHRLGPEALDELAARLGLPQPLAAKLSDTAILLRAYQEWLTAHQLEDADRWIELAAGHARRTASARLRFGGLWLDGFSEITPQQLDLLTATLPFSERSTLAFCLDHAPGEPTSWLSAWSIIGETFRKCHREIAAMPDARVSVDLLPRDRRHSRFGPGSELGHLEAYWTRPRPAAWVGVVDAHGQTGFDFDTPPIPTQIRLAICPTPEDEAELAAAEITKHVRQGVRYREIAVLFRSLDPHLPAFRRAFRRAGIPSFVDQREPAGHHPVAELTRGALRTVAQGWRHEDWFGALKSGLVDANDSALDRLENEAIRRGWDAADWSRSHTDIAEELDVLRAKVVRPFATLLQTLGPRPSGTLLAAGLRSFWMELAVANTLTEVTAQAFGALAQTDLNHSVLTALDAWLQDVEQAFHDECMTLAEWLPVLESALGNLTVGLVPPALDQVLIGTVDRSRNPNLQLVFLPGWNEGYFPADNSRHPLLSPEEGDALERAGVFLGSGRRQMGHERFLAYIALTRSRSRVVVSYSRRDTAGKERTPSPLLDSLKKLFPGLTAESWSAPGLAAASSLSDTSPAPQERLIQAVSSAVFGDELRSSVSRMEQFAACPFQFYAVSVLRLNEREEFELNARERGSFQHEVLSQFHALTRMENKPWRAYNQTEINERIQRIGLEVALTFRHGLLQSDAPSRHRAQYLIRDLTRLVTTLVQWMSSFTLDPIAVELPFGLPGAALPAWKLDLGNGRRLALQGKIDRIDAYHDPVTQKNWVFIGDYKSTPKKFEPWRAATGLQIQLPSYLAALLELLAEYRRRPMTPENARPTGDDSTAGAVAPELLAASPVAAGMAYIPLRPRPARQRPEDAGELAYDDGFVHRGRFDIAALEWLADPRKDRTAQFRLDLKKDGSPGKRGDLLTSTDFNQLLDAQRNVLRELGRRIVSGESAPSPFKHGTETACDHCDFTNVCGFDPGTMAFRKPTAAASAVQNPDACPPTGAPGNARNTVYPR
ncbi:MAG: hypothetical protein EXS36_02525 [Pedosphaera sp.]|nr:hypothetical protein [Pedosphaera sp.]